MLHACLEMATGIAVRHKTCTDHIVNTVIGLKAVASVTDTGNPRENSSLLLELRRTSEQSGENCQLLLRVDAIRFLLGLLFLERGNREKAAPLWAMKSPECMETWEHQRVPTRPRRQPELGTSTAHVGNFKWELLGKGVRGQDEDSRL